MESQGALSLSHQGGGCITMYLPIVFVLFLSSSFLKLTQTAAGSRSFADGIFAPNRKKNHPKIRPRISSTEDFEISRGNWATSLVAFFLPGLFACSPASSWPAGQLASKARWWWLSHHATKLGKPRMIILPECERWESARASYQSMSTNKLASLLQQANDRQEATKKKRPRSDQEARPSSTSTVDFWIWWSLIGKKRKRDQYQHYYIEYYMRRL